MNSKLDGLLYSKLYLSAAVCKDLIGDLTGLRLDFFSCGNSIERLFLDLSIEEAPKIELAKDFYTLGLDYFCADIILGFIWIGSSNTSILVSGYKLV